MMKTIDHGYGWCCVDCLFMLANGEVESWDEWETYAWEKTVEANLGEWRVGLGGEHREHCQAVDWETQERLNNDECDCEHEEFSWRACDVCRSHLGGSRDAVHFWTEEEGK